MYDRKMQWNVVPALIRRAILIAALLLAQASAATHVDLDDTHPAGESCIFCVGVSTLGAGNVGDAVLFHAIIEPQDVASTATVVSVIRRVERYSIRSPPIAS
jgi:hypothetical protein